MQLKVEKNDKQNAQIVANGFFPFLQWLKRHEGYHRDEQHRALFLAVALLPFLYIVFTTNIKVFITETKYMESSSIVCWLYISYFYTFRLLLSIGNAVLDEVLETLNSSQTFWMLNVVLEISIWCFSCMITPVLLPRVYKEGEDLPLQLVLTFLAAFLKKPLQIAFCTLAVFLPQVTTSSLCLRGKGQKNVLNLQSTHCPMWSWSFVLTHD